jgi:hypothetical protein
MKDLSLDAETAERMLRGEPTGPPDLAELLAAASSDLATADLHGEEAAVATFRQRGSLPSRRPSARRLFALVSIKAALIGLLLLLAGSVTLAAAAQHLSSPPKNTHSTPRTPSPALVPHIPTRAPSQPIPDQPDRQARQPTHPTHPAHPTHRQKTPHPRKSPRIQVKQQITGQSPRSVVVTPPDAWTVERNSPCLSLASSRLGRTAFNATGEARTC